VFLGSFSTLLKKERVRLTLPISETEVIQVRGIWSLLAVSVHLKIDGDPIPAGRDEERRIGLVQDGGHAIQSD
jgi:hypothetical protein